MSFIKAKPSALLSHQASTPQFSHRTPSTTSTTSTASSQQPDAAKSAPKRKSSLPTGLSARADSTLSTSTSSASTSKVTAGAAMTQSDSSMVPDRDPLPPTPDSLLIAKAAGDAFSQSTRFQTSPNLTSLVREARAVTAPNPPLSSSIASPSMPSLTAGSTSPPDIASPSLGSRPSMRRTNREKQMRIPKMVLLASYKSIRESRIVPTKGVLVDSNDTVQGVVNTLLEAFEVFTRNPDSFTLYVPAPINVWLKRSATFSAYKFVRNRMEVELREVPLEAKPQALGGGIQVQSKRRTMTVDLNRDKPMTLRLFYRAEGRPDSPREIDVTGSSAGSANGGVPAPMPAGTSGRRPASPTAAAATPSPSTSGVFDPLLLDSEQTQTRVMVFRRSDTVDLILAHGAHTFKLPAGVPWALYAPPPFDVWLEETYAIGHYTFLDSHMNVYIMPKDNNVILKVQLGDKGDITRVLKVPPTTLVRDVCHQLSLRFPVADLSDWGLIGKEKLAPVRLWLPDDQPLCAFPNINMHYLMFRKRDDVAKNNRRESVQVKTEAKPTTCIGVSPDDLDQVDDRGTQVPVCLVTLAEVFVKKYGLQTEAIMSKPADDLQLNQVFRDVDAGRPLDAHSVHTLVTAILHWYSSLPVRIFQPLHEKLVRAATSYEASLLLAAQLPQRAGLLFAWLMQLATDVLANGDVNQVTVEELSRNLAPVLIQTDNEVIKTKLPRIIAVILRDKLDERTERQEALQGAVDSSSFDFDEDDDEEDAGAAATAAAAAADAGAPLPTDDKPPVEKVDTWSVQRVAEWMRGLGEQFPECAELAANLERDMVDGASLIVLDKADVVRLGVTKIGLQKKFFKLVDDLKAQ